ncbi:MAG: flagellar hook-length control protein FliK [Roseinatronobacter sp.]
MAELRLDMIILRPPDASGLSLLTEMARADPAQADGEFRKFWLASAESASVPTRVQSGADLRRGCDRAEVDDRQREDRGRDAQADGTEDDALAPPVAVVEAVLVAEPPIRAPSLQGEGEGSQIVADQAPRQWSAAAIPDRLAPQLHPIRDDAEHVDPPAISARGQGATDTDRAARPAADVGRIPPAPWTGAILDIADRASADRVPGDALDLAVRDIGNAVRVPRQLMGQGAGPGAIAFEFPVDVPGLAMRPAPARGQVHAMAADMPPLRAATAQAMVNDMRPAETVHFERAGQVGEAVTIRPVPRMAGPPMGPDEPTSDARAHVLVRPYDKASGPIGERVVSSQGRHDPAPGAPYADEPAARVPTMAVRVKIAADRSVPVFSPHADRAPITFVDQVFHTRPAAEVDPVRWQVDAGSPVRSEAIWPVERFLFDAPSGVVGPVWARDGAGSLHWPRPIRAEQLPTDIRPALIALAATPTVPSLQVSLDPVELGRVRIALHPTETGVQVQILAERPDTLDLMRRFSDDLARTLSEMGLGDVSMQFSQNGARDRFARARLSGGTPSLDAHLHAPMPELEAPRAVRDDTRMDLRL